MQLLAMEDFARTTTTRLLGLNQAESRVPVKVLCGKRGISDQRLYNWKARYSAERLGPEALEETRCRRSAGK